MDHFDGFVHVLLLPTLRSEGKLLFGLGVDSF